MNLRTLWYFLSAVSSGGVSAAARHLGLAQSTISAAVSALETEMGTRLFEQTALGPRPTAAAVHLRDYASWLLLETEQAFRELGHGRASPVETLQVYAYGFPRCSVVDWAIVQGMLSSVEQGGPRSAFIASDRQSVGLAGGSGVALRYRIARPSGGDAPAAAQGSVRIEDEWLAVTLGGDANEGPIGWQELKSQRMIAPAVGDLAATSAGRRRAGFVPEVVPLDEAGAPYTLLGHKDAALLVPSAFLPPGYAASGVRVRRVLTAPFVPVLEIEATGARSADRSALVGHIAGAVRRSFGARTRDVPPMRTLAARVDLHTLRCFEATVETGNTARAAQSCFIVQPALSGQIRKLEKALSRQLFVRSHAGMTPTPAGRRLHALVDPILHDHATALERLRDGRWSGQARGRVRLGIIPAANEDSLVAESAADALAEWRAAFPDMPISVAEGYTSVLLRWLRTQLIDLAIIDTTESQPGLHLTPIFRESITLVFAPGSRWDTGAATIQGTELAAGQLAIPSKRFGLRTLFDKAFAAAGVSMEPGLEVDSLAIVLRLVRSGQWATILPPSAVHRQLAEGSLRQRLLAAPFIERRVCAAIRSKSRVSPETDALLTQLGRAFRMRAANPELTFQMTG